MSINNQKIDFSDGNSFTIFGLPSGGRPGLQGCVGEIYFYLVDLNDLPNDFPDLVRKAFREISASKVEESGIKLENIDAGYLVVRHPENCNSGSALWLIHAAVNWAVSILPVIGEVGWCTLKSYEGRIFSSRGHYNRRDAFHIVPLPVEMLTFSLGMAYIILRSDRAITLQKYWMLRRFWEIDEVPESDNKIVLYISLLELIFGKSSLEGFSAAIDNISSRAILKPSVKLANSLDFDNFNQSICPHFDRSAPDTSVVKRWFSDAQAMNPNVSKIRKLVAAMFLYRNAIVHGNIEDHLRFSNALLDLFGFSHESGVSSQARISFWMRRIVLDCLFDTLVGEYIEGAQENPPASRTGQD
ncbi:MAG: hypothetical protein ACK5LJ_14015 [Paracoccus sp. (in: a-proteobacteria)]